jgi:6-phosphogluconolactonase
MSDLVYVGGYGSGISVYARDGARLSHLGTLDTPDPSYLIADPSARRLYAVNELGTGTVTSYAVGPDGMPSPLSTEKSGGGEPCHLALCQGYLIAANYGTGSASVHPVGAGGELGPASDLVQHQGTGPDTERQEGPHAHQVHVSGDQVTIVDLGIDRLMHYRLDAGRLVPVGETALPPGAGPRHVVTHPSGHWFVACELDSTIVTYEPGDLRVTPATKSTVDRNYPSGIALSGDLLYVGNRGANTIATFAVGADGSLAPVAEVSSGGVWPRQFALAQGGAAAGRSSREDQHLFVANQNSGTVVALHLDPATGMPSPTGEVVEVAGASCVLPTGWTI